MPSIKIRNISITPKIFLKPFLNQWSITTLISSPGSGHNLLCDLEPLCKFSSLHRLNEGIGLDDLTWSCKPSLSVNLISTLTFKDGSHPRVTSLFSLPTEFILRL